MNLVYALLPYFAVGLGLLVFHNAWAAILTYHAGILAVLFLKPGIPLKDLVRNNGNKWLVVSAVIGACGGVILYLFWPLLSIPPGNKWLVVSAVIGACGGVILYLFWPLLSIPPGTGDYIGSIGLMGASWPVFMAYYALVNPFLEEYYWRGCLGGKSKRPVLQDLLFAGYHLLVLGGNLSVLWLAVTFLILCGAAWYWRQISRMTGGLLAAALSHLAADLTVILAIYYKT